MKTLGRFLLVLVALIAVAAPALAAEPAKPAAFPNKVLHVFMCEMEDDVTEEQVEAIAQAWQ